MKFSKIIKSDIILSLLGGIAIGMGAISFVEPVEEGHKHIYDSARAISVEQPIAENL